MLQQRLQIPGQRLLAAPSGQLLNQPTQLQQIGPRCAFHAALLRAAIFWTQNTDKDATCCRLAKMLFGHLLAAKADEHDILLQQLDMLGHHQSVA